MENFLLTSLTFPTVLYSGLLSIVTLYWIFSIIGFFDIDVLDINTELDMEAEGDISFLGQFLSKFKLDGVPLTISLSLIILFSWVLCFLVTYWFSSQIPQEWLRVIVGLWIIVLAPFITVPIVFIIIAPLKPLFTQQQECSAKDIIGQVAIVRSSKVTANFGEASFDNGGASLILKIRTTQSNKLKRGDQVILKKYNIEKHSYFVIAKQ